VVAHLEVSRVLVFSEDRIAEARARLLADYRRDGVPEDVLAASIAYGEAVGSRIVRWASGDLYRESRSFPRYTPLVEPGRWVPTPPEYLDSVEPHWPRIRPLVLASADEVRPPPPPPFATDPGSEFHRQANEVYETGRGLDAEREAIARFWDCNPFAVEVKGHLMLSRKRASPGAHWIAVAAIAARQTKADLPQTARLYAATAVALFDAFLACWDEKYRSHLIRPETYINRYLDVGWRPLLQTPPFPEYPSGHSVVSNAAAEVLTALLGDGFAYSDTSEVEYGLPARDFRSFRAAASEAAISRLYGGIHFRAAIENGNDMGRRVGALVVERLALPASVSRGTDRAANR
jgi:hypothetical protein